MNTPKKQIIKPKVPNDPQKFIQKEVLAHLLRNRIVTRADGDKFWNIVEKIPEGDNLYWRFAHRVV